MISMLAEKFGAERVSYIIFGLSQVLFPLSFIYVNDNKFNFVQTSLVRGLATMALNFCIIRYYDMGLDYKYDVNWINLIKRNVIMVIHGLAITLAQFYLPLPIVHTINFFAPIFIFIIDYIQNGIRVSRLQFYSLLLGILGILCTINDELFAKLLDPNYQMKTEFKNYIRTEPYLFALYSLCLCGIMFLWAYGLLRVRTFYKNNHTQVNFHFGLLLVISSGFLYPNRVVKKTELSKMFIAFFATGLPLALGQLFFVAGLGLNKKTGQLIILTGIPVIIGYLVSFIRYGEIIKPMETIGSFLILLGLIGVINCGVSQVSQNESSKIIQSSKLIGDPSNKPTQILFNTMKMA